MTKSKKRPRRKYLLCSAEEFFTTALLICGPPPTIRETQAFHIATKQGFPLYGTTAFVMYSDYGTKFTQCVTECGEAKARARQWYIKFRQWFEKQKERGK